MDTRIKFLHFSLRSNFIFINRKILIYSVLSELASEKIKYITLSFASYFGFVSLMLYFKAMDPIITSTLILFAIILFIHFSFKLKEGVVLKDLIKSWLRDEHNSHHALIKNLELEIGIGLDKDLEDATKKMIDDLNRRYNFNINEIKNYAKKVRISLNDVDI